MTAALLIHVLAAVLLPPLLTGVIQKTKAAFGGRNGPPVLQLYFDLFKLLGKSMVFSKTTTWVFRAGPAAGLASSLAASLLVPLGDGAAPVAFSGDMILLACLFGLGRFFTAAAALDTGSPFEGMGAAREMTFSCLVEPVLFIGFAALARLTGTDSLSGMLSAELLGGWGRAPATLALIAASWFIILLAENCRVPFDDPATHLELTMVHEVLVLDHSGPALAFIQHGASVKLLLLSSIILHVIFPFQAASPWWSWGMFIAGMVLMAILIGVVESIMARLRLLAIPKLLVSACLMAAFGVVFLTRGW